MPSQISRTDQTLADLDARGLHQFARDLRARGFCAIVSLESGVPATQCYLTHHGRLEYVAGSRRLFERYTNREECDE